MAGFVKLLMIAFTAAMVENAIFSRALVTRKMLFLKNREEILTFSAVITLMTVISGVICYAADSLLLYPRGVSIYIRSALYVLIMAAVHTAMIVAASRKAGEWYARAKNVLLMAGYNVAVLGTIPVSYTHLDVYKRQEAVGEMTPMMRSYCPAMRARIPGWTGPRCRSPRRNPA